jgi:hypothetical protein
MPSVDGMLSTRIIRFLEKESKHNPKSDSRHSPNSIGSSQQRVPIIVVSASLHEENRFDYIQNGYVYFSHLKELLGERRKSRTNC